LYSRFKGSNFGYRESTKASGCIQEIYLHEIKINLLIKV